jgi:hypothetical protein
MASSIGGMTGAGGKSMASNDSKVMGFKSQSIKESSYKPGQT